MQYKLEKDEIGNSHAIAIMVRYDDTKPYDWIGSLYHILDNQLDFQQRDTWNLNLQECRLVIKLADEVCFFGLDKAYEEADEPSEFEL
jgi:hypothetical protein